MSDNQYGYLKDGVYLDGGIFLTVDEVTSTHVQFNERFNDIKQNACYNSFQPSSSLPSHHNATAP